MPAHAVTFDLWHTLLDLPPFAEAEYMRRQWAIGGEVVADAPEGPVSPDVSIALDPWDAFRRAYEEAVVAAREGSTVTPGTQVVRAGALAGRRPRPETYEQRLERLVDDTPFRAVRGAKPVLESLRMYGCRLAIISNTVGEPGRSLERALARHGLARSFDAFVWSDEHPWTKPSRQLFDFALGRLHAKASEAIHVGDGPSDILGAQGAGYRATILFEGSTDYAPDYRKLFVPTAGPPLAPSHRARKLDEILPLVHREFGFRGTPR
ncbi:MAG: HAD family hydrolase [Thermoplasmata archaeon]|nr:HAD family hydrolase [Thermoplasmata archaeon]